jgi:hypothetical protein
VEADAGDPAVEVVVGNLDPGQAVVGAEQVLLAGEEVGGAGRVDVALAAPSRQ